MKRLALIGYPLDHSLSPVMHSAALKAMGLSREFRYDLQPTLEHELQDSVMSIKKGILEGANITIPYKTDVMKYIDIISEEALAIGSVNTLFRLGNAIVGSNTDALGFMNSLKDHNISLKGLKASILGAGGVAKAVAYALVEKGVTRLDILNRSVIKAVEIAKNLSIHGSCETNVGPLDSTNIDLSEIDLLVNCTPVGMSGHSLNATPLKQDSMHRDLVVMDLVYNPRRTRLLKDAEQIGCRTIEGTGMLVHQGAAALEIWIGKKPPIDVMKNMVIQELGG